MTELFVVTTIVLAIVAIVLFTKLSSLKQREMSSSESLEQLQNRHSEFINNLQKSHSTSLSQLEAQISNKAGEQFQLWREKECENIRLKERETALKEASFQLEQWVYQSETTIRNDAIQRSQSVIIGKVTEHLLPYMPEFPFNPRDVKFIGSPIDLIVFDGMSEGNIKQVVLVEIKTGQSATLTPRERQIRQAIKENKVIWQEMRIRRES